MNRFTERIQLSKLDGTFTKLFISPKEVGHHELKRWVCLSGLITNNNELTEIGKELAKFIAHINKTEK